METDEELRRVYGENIRITRFGVFTLIHMDDTTPEVIAQREKDFNPDEYFMDDCPLCNIAKQTGGHIVYDRTEEASNGEAQQES